MVIYGMLVLFPLWDSFGLTPRAQKPDIGTIASSLSSAMSSITSALERLPSSNSLRYLPSCHSFIQRIYMALRGNRDLCVSFLRRCADYGEKVIGCRFSPIALPICFRVTALRDLRERTMRSWSEMTGVSAVNAASVQGLSSYQSAPFWSLPLTQVALLFIRFPKVRK